MSGYCGTRVKGFSHARIASQMVSECNTLQVYLGRTARQVDFSRNKGCTYDKGTKQMLNLASVAAIDACIVRLVFKQSLWGVSYKILEPYFFGFD